MLARLLKRVLWKLKLVFYFLHRTWPFRPNIESFIPDHLEKIKNGIPHNKILYLAVKYDYGDKSRGLSYEEYNFFHSLKNIDNIEIVRLDIYTIFLKYGKKFANEIIKEVSITESVDKIIFFLYLDIIDYDIIKEFSDKYPIETIIWLFDDDKRYQETIELTKSFNKIVTTIKQRHELRLETGLNSYLSQFGANNFLFKDFNLERHFDVTFVGQNFGDRSDYINFLIENNINVNVFGGGWSNGRLSQSEMIEIFNKSKIVLNFSSSSGNKNLKFLKGRVFEIPATGAFLLTEVAEELELYFEAGKDLDVFSNKEELLEKINYYLSNDEIRKNIAKNGKNKILKDYTVEKHLKSLLNDK